MDFSISSSSFNILWKYEGAGANIFDNHIFRNAIFGVLELERQYNMT